jgi:hypothetical protein
VTSRVRPAFLRRLARLSAREWLDLAEAQIELLVAKAIVATRPTGQLVSRAPQLEDIVSACAAPAVTDERPEELALAMGRAAEHGIFRPLCLVRPGALKRTLERHGNTGRTERIGVRMNNGRFAAHAWVAYGAQILGDQEWHVDSFEELNEITVVDHS